MKQEENRLRSVLSIAGSDPSGGAGMEADLKTVTVNGVYGMAVITALTAQNTLGVHGIYEVPPAFIEAQLDAVFEDITPDAVKIGMVPSPEAICAVSGRLRRFGGRNLVVDPVMVSTSGAKLMKTEAVSALCEELIPLARLITPNIPEAEVLAGESIRNAAEMERAARKIFSKYGCAVLLKGGHSIHEAHDFLCGQGYEQWFFGERAETRHTHGTGCTLSSAIAAHLAKGAVLPEAIRAAKAYLFGALSSGRTVGHGIGPADHLFSLPNSQR